MGISKDMTVFELMNVFWSMLRELSFVQRTYREWYSTSMISLRRLVESPRIKSIQMGSISNEQMFH